MAWQDDEGLSLNGCSNIWECQFLSRSRWLGALTGWIILDGHYYSHFINEKILRGGENEAIFPHHGSLWHNQLVLSAVNQKVGGSSPPRETALVFLYGNSFVAPLVAQTVKSLLAMQETRT